MNKKVIIFDFDGVIAKTLEMGVKIYNTIALKKGYKKITKKNQNSLRDKSIPEILKELKIPFFQSITLASEIRNTIKNEMEDISPTDGIQDIFFELKKRGYKIGILSSNSMENVKKFLSKNIFPELDFIYCDTGLFGKDKKILKLISDKKFNPADVIYVGDEVRDIVASKKSKVDIVSVTWGANSKKALSAQRPNFLLNKPFELLEIFK